MAQDDVLLRVQSAARAAVGRGVSSSKTVFNKNVRQMASLHRDVAGHAIELLLQFPTAMPEFPTSIDEPAILPSLVAQQIRVFSRWADRAAELRQDRARTEDWRFTTVGRLIRKLTDDVRDEFVVVAERETARAAYAYEEFAGLTTMARELAKLSINPVIADQLELVADVAPASSASARGSSPREYRAALVQMLNHLGDLSDQLDALYCARALTH